MRFLLKEYQNYRDLARMTQITTINLLKQNSAMRMTCPILLLAILSLVSCETATPFSHIADWSLQPAHAPPVKGSPGESGPLRQKADAYDQWNALYHHPYHGGQLAVFFQDDSRTKLAGYSGAGDSCIWTGIYLGSQALRYGATGDPEAKKNILLNVAALDGYLHVTNTTGFIARYWGMQKSLMYQGDEWCRNKPDCHKVSAGKYNGSYWVGETTKDQYTGWFFGMALAYEFVDDEECRRKVRDDILEVVNTLIKNDWIIIDEKGYHKLISAGPRPTYVYQLSWLAIAYHISGAVRYKEELESRLTWYQLFMLEISVYSGYLNKYNQYYGHNLAHTTWYNLLRLGKSYFSSAAYQQLKHIFSSKVHGFVDLAHNPWFTGIFMSQGEYEPSATDLHKQQLAEDLTDFPDAPRYERFVPARDRRSYELDPVTSWIKYFPALQGLLEMAKVKLKPQAKRPFPQRQQCHAGFQF